ncbi:DegV family EDD domain-containing protein [Corynebacterium poyangense]|uniref:DegV family EDD domain-containing protein n=1 Tax=Corynebacterium poyangense TaxID=2684405 RepID=A0A7H0SQE6_9CORY|nr:DegV family protein [Corynebacterium poyangense]MBZ8178346.1 DegV family EDD domain-containing protein [Corynebacterium poyangense]QNQ90771.1 DegV family EDD domain-containing protein [Corynebacterium poyangense]
MTVRIVTDSSSGLPENIVDELGITVIDLHLLSEDEQVPTGTAGLNALELTAAYARQLERGGDDGVVALHLGRNLSSTMSAALTAAAIFDNKVRVVETGTVGMAVGAAAMAAARLARDGASVDDCQEIAESTLARSRTWLYLDHVDAIRRSGRISTATAVISSTLASRPIMHIRDGRIELAAKTRTPTKAFSKLAELIQEQAEGRPVFVGIQHADALENAERLYDLFSQVLAPGTSIMIVPLPDVLLAHCGSGAIGVSVVDSDFSTSLR